MPEPKDTVITPAEAVEQKPAKQAKKFLDVASRESIKKLLTDASVSLDTDKASDDELLAAMQKIISSNFEQKVNTLQERLERYANQSVLHDKDFILRLYNLNVPAINVPIFRDTDAVLTDKQIWKKVRESGICPPTDITRA